MQKPFALVLVLAALLLPVRAEALENEDLLALVAMPLVVAAVSEMMDVPMNELVDVVTLLNDAAVPPSQFIEVVRYVPVALVVEDTREPRFVDWVRLREAEGVRGTALVASIEERLSFYDLGPVNLRVDRPVAIDLTEDFVPVIVRTRIAEHRSSHPHGGPPGQLKKQTGVQTGAEIVHGTHPGRVDASDRDGRERRPARVVNHDRDGKQKAAARDRDKDRKPAQAKRGKSSHDDDHPGGGKGHGKGKDKSHGGKGKG